MQIQTSKDYQKFRFLSHNRNIAEPTVKMLMSDPSFPINFCYKPIIVDENYGIIDGQHRYEAAKRLGISIYYVVQPDATVETMIKYNTQNKGWYDRDFLQSHAKNFKADYVYIDKLIQTYGWTLSNTLLIISSILEIEHSRFIQIFRSGELTFDQKDVIELFMDMTVDGFAKLKDAQPGNEWIHLQRRAYVKAYVKIFKIDCYKYEKFMKKLYLVFNKLPETSRIIDAQDWICKAMKWKELETNPTNE